MKKLSFSSMAAALALGSFGAVAQPAGTVKTGLIGSVTGPHATWEQSVNEGVRMAVAELNARGCFTVAGKKYAITLVEEDAQSKPEIAVEGVQKILNNSDVKIIMDVVASSVGTRCQGGLSLNVPPNARATC